MVDVVIDEAVDETEARVWLRQYNDELRKRKTSLNEASWAHSTDMNPATAEAAIQANNQVHEWKLKKLKEASRFTPAAYSEDLRRQFWLISLDGTPEDSNDLRQMSKLTNDIESLYSTGKACREENENEVCHPLEPDLEHIFATSRDYDELEWAWIGFRDAIGPAMRDKFARLVELKNSGAGEHGFGNFWELLSAPFEIENLLEVANGLWSEIRPLYVQLHAYVRRRLASFYGEDKVSTTGPIPAHLLGNIWAKWWSNIYDLVAPYPDQPDMNVTSVLLQKGYDPLRMFKIAEKFFTSIGLRELPEVFWEKSMIVRPADREVSCHPTSWDFYHHSDVRVKMCTEVNHEFLGTIHHELGHIQYFLQYEDQPMLYRDGANPGFHEAVGDTVSLSAMTPAHLRTVGLLTDWPDTHESEINFLLRQALDKIPALAMGVMIDTWQSRVFSGKITADEYNREWWKLRLEYQGLSPPVPRTEEDFDAGSKFHIVYGFAMMRYFVSYIIQFQFHESLCREAGYPHGQLHKCDIYGSSQAGDRLREMLRMGNSQPWPEAMKVMTGQNKMAASAILEYFQPLMKWLREQNGDESIGW
ncbi:PREDICTED: angiotensin-converting enzyme-like [Branchiostoma belcheri]|uniref:Angiotensin-converting enzyme n=1 Tax=Branchiostoma belcheri TaxID=7741 RepID=A0A6P5A2P2_BRABE|nr:PREDICTED: angiotensin-converting enzyme-like [Branchiostoma belcheri]